MKLLLLLSFCTLQMEAVFLQANVIMQKTIIWSQHANSEMHNVLKNLGATSILLAPEG
jgi:hypothetical protein